MRLLGPCTLLVLLLATSALATQTMVDLEQIEADTEADTYCLPYPSTPVNGASYWQTPKRPLILISGIAGTMLHKPMGGVFQQTWRKLWISFRTQDEVALQYLSGMFNGTMVVERYGDQVVARDDGFGLCSIDDLDPDLVAYKTDSYYYHELILYLVSIGYVPGRTLFGFPYDWRQSVRHEPALEKLHGLIHSLHESSKGPVDIITHSMGGLVTKAYVARYLEDAEKVLGTWTAIGTPWRGGGSLAYKAMVSGYQLDMTTVPIVNWGLTEPAAHAVELNWPSAFELMPDVDHDAWWQRLNLANPPVLTYQIIGQAPSTAQSSTEVKSLIQAVNAGNLQIFGSGTLPVPNPVNMLAWTHSDATREQFAALTPRLEAFRQQHSNAAFRVVSIEGSSVMTKFSLHFAKPVATPAKLQQETPKYDLVSGDGTVPYASSLSDGMGATHYEYTGVADHQRLLRTPEIYHTIRHALDLGCKLEGTWSTNIYTPSGSILKTETWTFKDDSALETIPAKIKNSYDIFNTTLPDGTTITGTLDRGCMSFQGTWYTTWRSVGTRVIGTQCTTSTDSKSTPVPHGNLIHTCVYGNWSNKTTLVCDDTYEEFEGACREILTPEKIDKGHKNFLRNIIILSCSIVAVLVVIGVVAGVAMKKCRTKDTGYRMVDMDDGAGMSLNNDDALANDDLF